MIPTAPLIGLTGRAGVGKDTIAKCLADLAGYRRVAFADALKRAAYASDPLIDLGPDEPGKTRRLSDLVDALGWDVVKVRYPDARRYAQNYGVAMRDELPGCWVSLAMHKADALREAGHPVVVTDVRFPDEVEAVKAAGGVVVRLHRSHAHNLGELAGHASERLVDELAIDAIVANNGSAILAAHEVLAAYELAKAIEVEAVVA